MAYATQDDMVTRYGLAELVQLTDDAGTGETGPRLATALSDAHQVIDGYVAGVYAVPLTPVPDLVTRWTCDLARFFLYRDGVPETVEKAYKAALAQVRDVARGDLTLACAGVEAQEDATADNDLATFDAPERVMADGPWGM